MAINTHQADHVEYIQDSNNKKHYLNAEYLDGHSYADISTAIGKKGTVTSVATADGITGGPITASGTIKANLKSYTKNTAEIGGGLYGVELDKNGKLAVNVPSAGFEDILKGITGRTQVEWNALNAGEYGSNSTYNGATLPPVLLENNSGFWNSASGKPLDISFHFTKKEKITTLQVKCPPYSGVNPTMTVYYAQKGDTVLTLYKEIATISTADRKAYEFNEEGISADYWVVRFTSSGWVDLRLCSPSGLFTTGLYTEECHQQIMDRFNGYQPVGNYALKNEIIAKSLTSAKGDMIYASAASTPTRLGIGSNGQFLSVADGAPKWVNNPNTDTHLTTGLYVGKANEKSNSATTNGNTYLKLFDNDTKRAQHLINGTGLTTVASDASGTITINSTLPTNLVTTNTEQFITGKKNFETDLNFGKYVSAYRAVGDAPANLHLMNSSQTTAGFFDTVIFAGAGDWLYLGHLKPTFSIKASFQGNGEESDTYSASLGYTRGWLDYLTDWDYQYGWCVRPAKVSATTPAIIQIKFTNMLYTDVLRLIITGHNLNDSSGNYSGFLDDYTIEVCTDYAKDTWTTVVNRTNASDNIGKGLIYALQTGSYTTCYGIRLKITKCHVNGNGSAQIKITSMQLRDYRPGFKFPDCLGVVSQNGGDVWGALNTNNNLRTHAVFPESTNSYNLGSPTQQYYGAYAGSFYENGTNISDKYLNKGTSSTVVNQVVYNPVEMKKALKVPSIRGENSGNNHMNGAPLYSLGSTMATENGQATGSSSLSLTGYTGATGNPRDTIIAQRASGDFEILPASRRTKGLCFSDSSDKWTIAGSPILTESSISTQQWTLTDVNGNAITVNICVK